MFLSCTLVPQSSFFLLQLLHSPSLSVHLLYFLPAEDLLHKHSVEVNHSECLANLGRVVFQSELFMTVHECNGVVHADKQEWLLEELHEEGIGDDVVLRCLLALLKEEALFKHVIDLFLLCQDLVLSQEFKKLRLRNFILLLLVEERDPDVLQECQVFVLIEVVFHDCGAICSTFATLSLVFLLSGGSSDAMLGRW